MWPLVCRILSLLPHASPETVADNGAGEEIFRGEDVAETREHPMGDPSWEKDRSPRLGRSSGRSLMLSASFRGEKLRDHVGAAA